MPQTPPPPHPANSINLRIPSLPPPPGKIFWIRACMQCNSLPNTKKKDTLFGFFSFTYLQTRLKTTCFPSVCKQPAQEDSVRTLENEKK